MSAKRARPMFARAIRLSANCGHAAPDPARAYLGRQSISVDPLT